MTDATARLPLDLADITAPVKSVTTDGEAFAWDEDLDPAWAGEWTYPAKGWTDAHREAWAGTHGHLIAVRREHAAVAAASEAYVSSPDYLLASAAAEVADTIRQKGIDERETAGLKAWLAARAQYGTNVRAIPTVEGDVVIMVGMTAKEIDAANAAAMGARDQRLRTNPDDKAAALSDYMGTHREWMLSKCIWPASASGDAKDKSRIREIAEVHPSLWADLETMREDMARARVDDAGKGFAL